MNEQSLSLISYHYNQLQRDGVTVIPNSFKDGLVENIRNKFIDFLNLNSDIFNKHLDENGHYPRMINMHLAFPNFLELFVNNLISLGVQDAFFNDFSSIYTTLYFERGSAQPIHRDTPYFTTRPEYNYLGVWVALENANSNNGCLEVIRGGHLMPELDREKIALQSYESLDDVPANSQILWDNYQSKVKSECLEAGLKVESIEVAEGDTVIWHPQLPHGGAAIRDIALTRHSLVMHVTPLGTPVYHQDVFFNPKKIVSEKSSFKYRNYKDRSYVNHEYVDIGHKELIKPCDFISAENI